jgi:putative drug exporter of the RND superfamily
MFSTLSSVVIRRPWVVVLSWLAVAVCLYFFAPTWDQVTKDDDVRFFPAQSLTVIGQELLERGFPADASSSQVVLVYERKSAPVTPDDLSYIENVAGEFFRYSQSEPSLGVKKIDTHNSLAIGPRLKSPRREGQGQAVLSIIRLNGTHMSKKTRLAVDRMLEWLETKRVTLPEGLALSVTGSAVVGHDTQVAAGESINNTTHSTIALVILILLFVYRSPLLAMVPLLTIALSVFVSLAGVGLLTKVPGLGYQAINITKVFVIVVLFGAGTDYCLFLIARYCEELGRGRTRYDALIQALRQVGSALVASAGTVIVGLGMLYFSSFAKVRYTGPTIALSLAVALLASLSLAPSLLAMLGRAIFWPRHAPHREVTAPPAADQPNDLPLAGFWARVADFVVSYPLLILTVCLIALVPLAVVGAKAKSSYNQLADLDPDRTSVAGANTIKRYFPVGELSPATALIANPTLDFQSPAGREAIAEISRRVQQIAEVAEVRSLTQPLGTAAAPAGNPSQGLFNRLSGAAVSGGALLRYVSTAATTPADRSHITRIEVVFKADPFSETSLNALDVVIKTVRAATAPDQPLEGTSAIGIAGSTAAVHALKAVTTSDEQRMYVLVTLGVYAILVALLRRPGISLYLIATVVLGYLASLGLTDLVFQALHRGPDPWGGLDWTVAFFLFVILVAVGEDYNILLMARVIEEERSFGTIEGTRRAVAHTGGIISSCGLIMAGTFGSMLTGSLSSLRELGFALGLGVLLDTFLVRPILVPAFVVLVERARPRSRSKSEAPSSDEETETNEVVTTTTSKG